MPQLRVARADTPTDPVERAHVVFSAAEAQGGMDGDWFIGRDRMCRMCIVDPSVSRQHLQVLYQGGVFHLRTISQYGSEIDGRRLTSSDPPVAVRKSLSAKVGSIELRCTVLDDVDDVKPVAEAPAVAAADAGWWASGQSIWSDPVAAEPPRVEPADFLNPSLWSDPTAAVEPVAGFEAEPVPSVVDWGVSDAAAAPHFGDPPPVPAPARDYPDSAFGVHAEFAPESPDSLDWTKDLHAAAASVSAAEPVKPVVAPAQAARGTADATGVVATILQSAGLRADIAALHAKDCTPEEIGALLAQLLGGLITTLSTRRTVKNTLRVAHTEVRIEGNNPLKHAVTPVEALIALVRSDRAGYLSPEQSIEGVFKDLSSHEVAVIDGVEEALKHVVELMSPESVERGSPVSQPKFALGGKRSREAQLWAQYRARFAELLGSGHAFSNHFLPAFREAYDARLAALRRKKT